MHDRSCRDPGSQIARIDSSCGGGRRGDGASTVFMLIIDVSILKGNMVMWYSVIDAGAHLLRHPVLNYRCRRAVRYIGINICIVRMNVLIVRHSLNSNTLHPPCSSTADLNGTRYVKCVAVRRLRLAFTLGVPLGYKAVSVQSMADIFVWQGRG
jgi:hypothetical protein